MGNAATRRERTRDGRRRLGLVIVALGAAALVDCTIERANDNPTYLYYAPCPDGGAPADASVDAPVASGGVGSACASDADCAGYANPSCQTALRPVADFVYPDAGPEADPFRDFALEFPGGYCTNTMQNACKSDADCGPGGGCYRPFEGVDPSTIDSLKNLPLPFDVGAFGAAGLCLHPCASDADCRTAEGYVCQVPICAVMALFNEPYDKKFCVTPNTGGVLVGNDDPTCPAHDGG